MSADLNRLMDNLRIRLPGAVDESIKLELFNTLKEFLSDSNCWVEDVDFPVTSDVTEYLVIPTGVAATVRLYGVVNSEQRAVSAVYVLPESIILTHAPAQADTYTARLVLTVTDPVTRDGYPEFPDWILNAYGDELMDGVLGRMMSQIAKPYSNERMAIYHMRRFRGGVAKAKVDAMHKYVYRGQNWSFPQSFARRRAR